LRLKTNDSDQYYSIATITIFYDFLLTLADEVSHVISEFLFATLVAPPLEGEIRLAGALFDDVTVFAIFLAVCSSL